MTCVSVIMVSLIFRVILNGQGNMNRSGPTHYDIGISLHYAYGYYRPITVDIIQYLD